MIGTSLEARVVAHVRGHLVAVHARHLDVEQDHVGHVLLQQRHRLDAVPRRQHAHAVALEQALRHAAHGDRVVDHQREDAVVAASRAARCRPSAPRHSERTSAPMSRMTTMRPSPRMVAPEMPRMAAICGPTGLTTISRLPTSSSATSAGGVLAGAHQDHRQRRRRLRAASTGSRADERRRGAGSGSVWPP